MKFSSRMDAIFLVNIFRLYLKVNSKCFYNCTQKSLFLSACYYWDGTISLREVDQIFLHGRKIGYGDSYLDSVFSYSKVYMQYYTMLLEQFDYKPVKNLATAT